MRVGSLYWWRCRRSHWPPWFDSYWEFLVQTKANRKLIRPNLNFHDLSPMFYQYLCTLRCKIKWLKILLKGKKDKSIASMKDY